MRWCGSSGTSNGGVITSIAKPKISDIATKTRGSVNQIAVAFGFVSSIGTADLDRTNSNRDEIMTIQHDEGVCTTRSRDQDRAEVALRFAPVGPEFCGQASPTAPAVSSRAGAMGMKYRPCNPSTRKLPTEVQMRSTINSNASAQTAAMTAPTATTRHGLGNIGPSAPGRQASSIISK